MTLVYVSNGAWGAGTGTPNSAAQVDGNFYDVDQRIVALNNDLAVGKRIDSVSNSPNSITFTFTDATTQVIPLPIATLKYKGIWANSTPYTQDDLFLAPGVGVYQVLVAHTTPALPAVFDPAAVSDDTDADPLYSAFLPLFDHFPLGGLTGQILRKESDGDYAAVWVTPTADIIIFSASTDSALISTNVADALEELETLINAFTVAAADVTFASSTDIVSSDVQSAIEEVFAAISATPDLSGYAPLASPALTGNPTAPTQSVGNNSTRLATTAFLAGEIGSSIAPLASPALTGNPTAPTQSVGNNSTRLATTAFLAAAIGNSIQAYDAQLSSLVRQNSQSTAYTTVLTDAGKHILHPSADTTARTFTIDSNANVAYPIGTAITFVNQHSGGVITIAITADTMRLAGAGTTGNRTLAADGIATALKIASTEWIISGTGLT